MSKLFKVEVECVDNPEDGFILPDTFTVRAPNQDVALETAYEMAWEQYPEVRILECGGIEEFAS